MFEQARRFRVLAALGLVLTLAQGRAWSQEPIWERAANFARRIGELPCIVISAKKPFAEQPPAIFAWETKDAAESHRGMAEFYERLGEPLAAYFRYTILRRRFPDRKEFAEAAERQRPQLWRTADIPWYLLSPCWNDSRCWNDGNSPILNPSEDQSGKPATLDSTVFPPGPSADADTPIEKPGSALLFGVGAQSDAGQLIIPVVRREPSFWLVSRPTPSESAAPALPKRKDILPDSECSRLLIQLGVIPGPSELLSLPRAATHINLDFGYPPGTPIIF